MDARDSELNDSDVDIMDISPQERASTPASSVCELCTDMNSVSLEDTPKSMRCRRILKGKVLFRSECEDFG